MLSVPISMILLSKFKFLKFKSFEDVIKIIFLIYKYIDYKMDKLSVNLKK